MLSSRAAVGSASQSAMSPAPTSTTDVPGGGTAVTVIAAVPFFPSLVAVMVAGPAVTPATSPLPLTVATPGLLLTQLIVRPGSRVPFASFGVAVGWTVGPCWTLADAWLAAPAAP